MNLGGAYADAVDGDAVTGHVVNYSYHTESEGYRGEMPIVTLRVRDADRQLHTVEIEGFRPFLYIRRSEFLDDPLGVLNDRRVIGVEGTFTPEVCAEYLDIGADAIGSPSAVADALTASSSGLAVHVPSDEMHEDLRDRQLVRVFAETPSDVGGGRSGEPIRALFEETFEADIPFTRRFSICTGITTGVAVPTTERRLRYENFLGSSEPFDVRTQEPAPADPPDVKPRSCIFDIEVATEGGGFPDPSRAKQPITAITAYDSYSEQYRLWALESNQWDATPAQVEQAVRDDVAERIGLTHGRTADLVDVAVFGDETELVESFHEWFLEREFDHITGWNSEAFDVPYLIQRSYYLSATQIYEWMPHGNPAVWTHTDDEGNENVGYKLRGRITLDLLDAYKKTQFRELPSYRLDDVAEAVLGYGKVDLDDESFGDAWHHDPAEFFIYNIRDVQAVVEIERESGLLDLYDNIRSVTGADYETCNHNGPTLDTMFLLRAWKQGLALPTNTEPEEGVYHGAKVFETVPGYHPNAVYPDLSSMYPNKFKMLNLGVETIIGDREDLENSEYTEDDVFRFPVDDRPFAVVPKGESYDHVDRQEYKGVKSEQGGLREMFDPEITWKYVLKPEIKESFIRDTISELIALKSDYTGAMYDSVKRIVNSVYGYMGDSETGGVGSRLYNRQIAEGITLAGRLTIQHTAESFTEYVQDNFDPDAELIGGDSVPATEPVIIRDEDGLIDVVPIKKLDGRSGDVEVWSDSGFTTVTEVIKKPNRKQTYITQTKAGIVRTTEDHGLLDPDGVERSPTDVEFEDELLHEDISNIDIDTSSFTTKRAWLLGLFAAEGSCGIYECQTGGKASWAINNQDQELLKKAQRILEDLWGLESRIADSMTSSNTYKLQLSGNGRIDGPVLGFREMLYDGLQKRVPQCILNADEDAKYAFLRGYHEGDGHFEMNSGGESKDFDQMTTKHEQLASGVTFLLKQLGYQITLDHKTREKSNGDTETYYRMRVVKWHVGSDTEVRSVEEYSEDCEYVYDLETENHHFHAGIGSLIVHNTDSSVTSIPNAPTLQHVKEWSDEAVEYVDASYDEFAEETFWMDSDDDDHRLEVELESVASGLFFIEDDDTGEIQYRMKDSGYLEAIDERSGVQKRYAQHIVWDDDDGWIDTPDSPDEWPTPAWDELAEAEQAQYAGRYAYYEEEGYPGALEDTDDLSELKYESGCTYATYEDGPLTGRDPQADIGIKGFEYVRSDTAQITKDAQLRVLTDILLSADPRDRIEPYLQALVDAVESEERPLADCARPKGISQALDQYGWKSIEELDDEDITPEVEAVGGTYVQKAGPTYRGAKYCDDHFEWEELGEGSKPMKIPIETVRTGGTDYPRAYEYDSYPQNDAWPDPPEAGEPVDAIAVEHPDRVPTDVFLVDYETIVTKELEEKIQPMLRTIDLRWDDLLAEGEQTGLDAWG